MIIWWDFMVIGQLMWGIAIGYQVGLRRAICRFGVLFCAVLAAILGKTDLKCFGARYGKIEVLIEAMVQGRLAIPVIGPVDKSQFSPDLPDVMWQVLPEGTTMAISGGGLNNFTVLLVQLFGYTFSFLAGLALWWLFFYLWAVFLSRGNGDRLSKASRWGGALIGMFRQFCCAALFIGVAVPMAWLCRVPVELMQLEKTFLARWAWNIFAGLGIWN